MVKAKSKLIQTFWTVSVLIGLTMLLYQVISVIVTYSKNLMVTTYVNSFQTPDFPDITICYTNPYPSLEKENPSESFDSFKQRINLLKQVNYSNIDWRPFEMRQISISNTLFFPHQSIHEVPGFIGCVSKDWSRTTTMENFCQYNITMFWHPNYHKCYTISNIADTSYFSLTTNVKNVEITNDDYSPSGLLEAGIQFLIHPKNTYPMVMSDGILLTPGTELNVVLIQENIIRLSKPYSNCTEQQFLFPNDPDSHKYTMTSCYSLCNQKRYITSCRCLDSREEAFSDTMLSNMTFCANISWLNVDNMKEFKKGFEDARCYFNGSSALSYYKDCECHPPCTETFYEISYNTRPFPSPGSQVAFYERYIESNNYKDDLTGWDQTQYKAYEEVKQLNSNGSTELAWKLLNTLKEIENNFIRMNVRFNQQTVETIEESALMTWETLMSNIGGSLSLWLGITIMTAAEFIELISVLFSMHFTKRKQIQNLDMKE